MYMLPQFLITYSVFYSILICIFKSPFFLFLHHIAIPITRKQTDTCIKEQVSTNEGFKNKFSMAKNHGVFNRSQLKTQFL